MVRVAIKFIRSNFLNRETNRMKITRELSLLEQFDHPFIAKFFALSSSQEGLAILEEYPPLGNIRDFLAANRPLTETQLQYYFMQLVSVLDYLHNFRKVTHRNLNLENILIDWSGNIKVIDFGLACEFSDENQTFSTPCQSPQYIPPEFLSTQTSTAKADIWALGVVLYAMATRTMPFQGSNSNELYRRIVYQRVSFPLNLSDHLIDMLRNLLCRDPSKRFSIAQVKAHPWFPAEEYANPMGAPDIARAFHEDSARVPVDREVIRIMRSNGLNCAGLEESLESGEESELTLLYAIYDRDAQMKRVNRSMRMATVNVPPPRERPPVPLGCRCRGGAVGVGGRCDRCGNRPPDAAPHGRLPPIPGPAGESTPQAASAEGQPGTPS